MAGLRTTKKVGVLSPDFLQKWLRWILGGFIIVYLYPIFVKMLRNGEIADKQSELKAVSENPQMLDDRLNDVTSNATIKNAARAIYEAFGLSYSWYNWQYYREDDERAYIQLKTVTRGYMSGNDFDALKECYYYVSGGNDLVSDVQKYLDKEYYKLLIW